MMSWEGCINLCSNVPMNILLAKLKKLCFIKNAAAQFKEKNFFETRVTEYQTGGALNWDQNKKIKR